MTATKKLVLLLIFVGVVLISLLFVSLRDTEQVAIVEKINLLAGNDFEGEAAVAEAEPEFDRAQFIKEMREAVLARHSVASVPVAMTTDSDMATAREELEEAAQSTEAVLVDGPREVRWCDATLLESRFLGAWPQTPVTVSDAEGALVISTAVVVPVGTTTATKTMVETLAQFPHSPAALAEPACLMHAYVGVTVDGRLIHNNDTILFAAKTAGEQIGYAFDGNPIYGMATDEAGLDACGGHEVAGEYRYQLRSGEDFILGCFVAEPQQNLQRG